MFARRASPMVRVAVKVEGGVVHERVVRAQYLERVMARAAKVRERERLRLQRQRARAAAVQRSLLDEGNQLPLL